MSLESWLLIAVAIFDAVIAIFLWILSRKVDRHDKMKDELKAMAKEQIQNAIKSAVADVRNDMLKSAGELKGSFDLLKAAVDEQRSRIEKGTDEIDEQHDRSHALDMKISNVREDIRVENLKTFATKQELNHFSTALGECQLKLAALIGGN